MDSRLFYSKFHAALRRVVWDKRAGEEYVLIGDGLSTDLGRLQALVERTFSEPVLCLPASRRTLVQFPSSEAAAQIAEHLTTEPMATVSDPGTCTFLQAHATGVARTGRAQANSSSKPTPLRGAA